MSPVTFDKFWNVIDGKLASTAATRHGINPARIEELPPVPVSTQNDVQAAVDAARRAAPAWAAVPLQERQRRVVQLAEALSSQQDDFAKMLTLEQGKTVCEKRLTRFAYAGLVLLRNSAGCCGRRSCIRSQDIAGHSEA